MPIVPLVPKGPSSGNSDSSPCPAEIIALSGGILYASLSHIVPLCYSNYLISQNDTKYYLGQI